MQLTRHLFVRQRKRTVNETWQLPADQPGHRDCLFAVWQLAAVRGWVDPLLLPSLKDIAITAGELATEGYRQVSLWQSITVSLARALSAFAASVVIGIPLGLMMGISPLLSAILNPFVQFLRPLPKIALIPLAVVWLGIGEASKFFLIFIATVLSIIVGAVSAVEKSARHISGSPGRLGPRAGKFLCG